LVRWLHVPDTPPQLPATAGERVDVFQPAAGFLGYMKMWFWIELVVSSVVFFVVWLMITIALPPLGLLLFLPAVALIVFLNAVFYVAIHLRYDTTWYVISERSLRIRRGIWVIHETTITYDNIQNIRVSQGPVERLFGFANLLVETAGGGGGGQDPQAAAMGLNRGRIEGVNNAHEIRDLISARLRHSVTAGLGDEDDDTDHQTREMRGVAPATSQQYVALLRQVRDAARHLEAARRPH
jgi:uncharacterized membrane protein YdbT with pleckstrin-like domain